MRFNLDDYIPVQERINQFWQDYPDGNIVTELMSLPDDFQQCRYKALVYKHRDYTRPDATGYAFETAGGNGPNSTSHEENCETSAIGRALANMGYATSHKDRPSREEMTKANTPPRQQGTSQNTVPASQGEKKTGPVEGGKGITWPQLNMIQALAAELGMEKADLYQFGGFSSSKDLTKAGASTVITRLKELQAGPPPQPPVDMETGEIDPGPPPF